jgi:hypothetical protein
VGLDRIASSTGCRLVARCIWVATLESCISILRCNNGRKNTKVVVGCQQLGTTGLEACQSSPNGQRREGGKISTMI